MATEHSIPSDGKIIIDFPKWNSFGISTSLYASQWTFESLVSVSTSPGEVTCYPLDSTSQACVDTLDCSFPTTSLSCLFTQGTGDTSDRLEVIMNDGSEIGSFSSL